MVFRNTIPGFSMITCLNLLSSIGWQVGAIGDSFKGSNEELRGTTRDESKPSDTDKGSCAGKALSACVESAFV